MGEYTIYRIVNNVDGMFYIGMTNHVTQRFARHMRDLKRGAHHNYRLQAAYNEHGRGAFELTIIETDISLKNIVERESFWITHYNAYEAGYNLYDGSKFQRGKRVGK